MGTSFESDIGRNDNLGTNFESDIDRNDKDAKFKVCDDVRISKYKTFLKKTALQIAQKKSSGLKNLKILYRRHI